MKAASVVEIRKELEHLSVDNLKQLCLRLARFKIENKELLTYLLFESENEESYILSIKKFTDNRTNPAINNIKKIFSRSLFSTNF